MKTRLFSVAVAALAALTIGHSAQAEEGHVSSILYSCNMSFHASGRSIYLGIGYTEVSGEGLLSCYDLLTGATQHIPLKVKARGPGVGLGITGLVLSGGATGVGLSAGPEGMLGHYAMVRGSASVGIGAGAGAALRLSNGAATINVSVQGQTGLGAGVDLLWVDIEAADRDYKKNQKSEPAPVAVAPASPAPVVQESSVPASTVTVQNGQPIRLVDQNGRLVQLIYVRQQ